MLRKKSRRNPMWKGGFKEIKLEETWSLEREGKYYIVKNKSAIIAFVIGKGEIQEDGFKLIGAHTDAPLPLGLSLIQRW